MEKMKSMEQEHLNEIIRLEKKLQQANNHIELMAKDLEDRDELLRQKEKKIFQYK